MNVNSWLYKAALMGCLFVVMLAGCSASTEQVDLVGAKSTASESTNQVPNALTMQRWSDSCALCHASGVAGAPRVGNAEEWAARVSKGRVAMLKSTVEGLNKMPPLGYCMSCEAHDFVSMIEFMAGMPQGALQ